MSVSITILMHINFIPFISTLVVTQATYTAGKSLIVC